MSTYTVTATRWEHGWELAIDHVGVTQAPSLSAAERMVRSYLAMDGHADAGSAAIHLEIPEFGDEVADVKLKLRAAEQAQLDSAEASRRLVRRLKKSGLRGTEIATVLEVSPQRVSQLLATT